MKNEEFFQMLNGMEDKYIEKASELLALQQEAREGVVVYAAPKSRRTVWKTVIASVAATAAAVFGVFVLAKNIISLGEPDISPNSGGNATENYFGGEGKFNADDNGRYFCDDSNFYATFGHGTLLKYNKNTNTLSLACDNHNCIHSAFGVPCKAKIDYCVFNGELIGVYNGNYWNGFTGPRGFMYICGEDDKLVYQNELPDGIDPVTSNNFIGYVFTLEDDYLVLHNGGYIYILDKDFNIAYTVFGAGSYMGGVYYVDNEIYYIDDLYRLQKLDMESGEPSLVDLGGMNIWEGFVEEDVLWFSNGEALCSYDFKTGEIKEHAAEKAVRLSKAGKYIKYMIYNVGDVYLYDPETGETQKRDDININVDVHFHDGVYYVYNDTNATLTLYEEDLTTVIKTCTLE